MELLLLSKGLKISTFEYFGLFGTLYVGSVPVKSKTLEKWGKCRRWCCFEDDRGFTPVTTVLSNCVVSEEGMMNSILMREEDRVETRWAH